MSLTAVILAPTLAVLCGAAREDPFPVPTGMSSNVAFWLRVYTEWPTNRYAIHDDEDLSIVYRVIPANDGRSPIVRQAKLDVEAALARLDASRPAGRQGLKGIDLEVFDALSHSHDPGRFARARGHVRHQKGQRDRFADALRDSGRYRAQIEEILVAHGLPPELIALVFVESMFQLGARSYSGATGIWQFMRATGREYLNINDVVDERRDPVVATYAAASYLRSAHRRLGSWPVAITSYNYGMNGMARAIQSTGSRDLRVIVDRYRSGRLGFAAKNYYTEFLAALRVWRDPKRYFPEVTPRGPWRYDVVRLPAAVAATELIRAGVLSAQQLEQLNPALTRKALLGQVALPHGMALRVPPGTTEQVAGVMSRLPGRRAPAVAPRDRTYQVRAGDSVTRIARAHGVQIGQVLSANGLALDSPIYPGMTLTIPAARSSTTLLPGARDLTLAPSPEVSPAAAAEIAAVSPAPEVATRERASRRDPPRGDARAPRGDKRQRPLPPVVRTIRVGQRRHLLIAGPPEPTTPPEPGGIAVAPADALTGTRPLPDVEVLTGTAGADADFTSMQQGGGEV